MIRSEWYGHDLGFCRLNENCLDETHTTHQRDLAEARMSVEDIQDITLKS